MAKATSGGASNAADTPPEVAVPVAAEVVAPVEENPAPVTVEPDPQTAQVAATVEEPKPKPARGKKTTALATDVALPEGSEAT